MSRSKKNFLDFEIDKLTKSIENVASGDSFQTEIAAITPADLKIMTKKKGWLFDWKNEFAQPEREVYKLTIAGNPFIIQGAISFESKQSHVFMHLLESASFNRGANKIYAGVPGNLVAYACRRSFQIGFDGYVSFQPKTKLIDHYIKTLGAKPFGKQQLVIESDSAFRLVSQYFKS